MALIDPTPPSDNTEDLIKDLTAATSQKEPAPGTKQDPPKEGEPSASQDQRPDWIDEKFWTGNLEESTKKLQDSYTNLQSAYGRVNNDLGVQRKLTDQILNLDEKRLSDIEENTPPVEVTGADLLDNPNEALERWYQDRKARDDAETAQRLDGLEASLVERDFLSRHSDYQTVASSAEFQEWVNESPLRVKLAQQAYSGDWSAADDVLSEYKLTKASTQASGEEPTPGTDAEGLEAAKQAGLESSNNSEGAESKPTYSRAALIKLKLENPEAYEKPEFQEEILTAYAEGRVK